MVFNGRIQQCFSILVGRIIGARNQIVKYVTVPLPVADKLYYCMREGIELAHLKDSKCAQVIALLFYEQDIHSEYVPVYY